MVKEVVQYSLMTLLVVVQKCPYKAVHMIAILETVHMQRMLVLDAIHVSIVFTVSVNNGYYSCACWHSCHAMIKCLLFLLPNSNLIYEFFKP